MENNLGLNMHDGPKEMTHIIPPRPVDTLTHIGSGVHSMHRPVFTPHEPLQPIATVSPIAPVVPIAPVTPISTMGITSSPPVILDIPIDPLPVNLSKLII